MATCKHTWGRGLIVILVYLSVNSADGLGILYFLTCVYYTLVQHGSSMAKAAVHIIKGLKDF